MQHNDTYNKTNSGSDANKVYWYKEWFHVPNDCEIENIGHGRSLIKKDGHVIEEVIICLRTQNRFCLKKVPPNKRVIQSKRIGRQYFLSNDDGSDTLVLSEQEVINYRSLKGKSGDFITLACNDTVRMSEKNEEGDYIVCKDGIEIIAIIPKHFSSKRLLDTHGHKVDSFYPGNTVIKDNDNQKKRKEAQQLSYQERYTQLLYYVENQTLKEVINTKVYYVDEQYRMYFVITRDKQIKRVFTHGSIQYLKKHDKLNNNSVDQVLDLPKRVHKSVKKHIEYLASHSQSRSQDQAITSLTISFDTFLQEMKQQESQQETHPEDIQITTAEKTEELTESRKSLLPNPKRRRITLLSQRSNLFQQSHDAVSERQQTTIKYSAEYTHYQPSTTHYDAQQASSTRSTTTTTMNNPPSPSYVSPSYEQNSTNQTNSVNVAEVNQYDLEVQRYTSRNAISYQPAQQTTLIYPTEYAYYQPSTTHYDTQQASSTRSTTTTTMTNPPSPSYVFPSYEQNSTDQTNAINVSEGEQYFHAVHNVENTSQKYAQNNVNLYDSFPLQQEKSPYQANFLFATDGPVTDLNFDLDNNDDTDFSSTFDPN